MRRVAGVLHEVIAHFLAMDGILSNKDNPKTTPKSREKYCAAFDCKNSCYDSHGHRTRYHFFRFPKKIKQRNRWCNLIKRQHGKDGFSVNSSTVVCSEHFKKEEIIRKLGGRWDLKKGKFCFRVATAGIFDRSQVIVLPKQKVS